MRLRPVLGLLLAGLIGGCAGGPVPVRSSNSPVGAYRVYVVDRGWHTEIGLPAAALDGRLAALADEFPGARFLTIGFGDRHYLLARDTGFLDLVRALFPGDSALLVTGLKASPGEAFGEDNVVALGVSAAGFHRIEDFIADNSAAGRDGKWRRLADGPYPGSLFFASDATYDAFYTCNSWVADALEAGGLSLPGGLVIFADQVMAEARDLSGREQAHR